uniref:replication initiation protein n=1 Tax=Lentilactobacillus hilgardii TaxID=1588 RepID=UPI00403F3932
MPVNKKANNALKNLLSRENYLVVQANDLARAFGGLSAFEHRILDYSFSFVKKDSTPDEEYEAKAIDILHMFGFNTSGKNYERVARAFKALNENTALYLRVQREDGTLGIRMTQLFSHIDIYGDGKVKFKFSEEAAPYIFNLKKHFYSFKLSQLSRIKSKYTLILMKLWEANNFDRMSDTVIPGTLEEWESWFFGDNPRWSAGRFKQKVLDVATSELENKFDMIITIQPTKDGRRVTGYEITIPANEIRH